jgi:cytochrome c-type biogenesis protein CcmE
MIDRKSRMRLLVVTMVILGIVGYMIYNSSTSSYAYFKKVGEVTADSSLIGKSIRVGGSIVKNSIVQTGRRYTFKISEHGKELTVVYSGQLPSTFGDEVYAIAEGKLVSTGMLEAKSVITQCPSKYESKKAEVE